MAKTTFRWARKLGRGFRRALRTMDAAAEKIADRPMKQVRHGRLEWTADAEGRPVRVGGTGFPDRPTRRPVRWTAAHTHRDKEVWRATFDSGVTVDFVTWPLSRRDLEARAHAEREARHGVYSADWPLNDLTLLRTVDSEAEDEDE